jgi:ATP-dependent Clp protease adaptor protein ClpS
MPPQPERHLEPEGDVAVRPRVKKPRPWRVILHNDDYTTMAFVIHVLQSHFGKTAAEATHVMLQVHHKGSGVAGIYPRDVAETKVEVVTEEARANGMPLLVEAEPDPDGGDDGDDG